LTFAGFALAVAALFTQGHIGAGEREDRGNRWVIAAFGFLGLLLGCVPAYTERMGILTVDGDAVRWIGVVLNALAAGRFASILCLCLVAASAALWPFNLVTRW